MNQKLFNYFAEQHRINLVASEMDEIKRIVIEDYEREQWRPYPECKPENGRKYLGTFYDGDVDTIRQHGSASSWFCIEDKLTHNPDIVIAFRELPKPYQP